MLSLDDIGRVIAVERHKVRLSQTGLARRAQVSRPTIERLENGRASDLGYSKLVRILATLGLELRLHELTPARPTLDDLLREDSDA